MDAKDVRINGRYLCLDMFRRRAIEVTVECTGLHPGTWMVTPLGDDVTFPAPAVHLFRSMEEMIREGLPAVDRAIEENQAIAVELFDLRQSLFASHPPTGDDEDDDTEEYGGEAIAPTPVVDVEVLT